MVIGNHIGLPFGKHKGVPKPPITEVIWNPNVTSNVSPTNTQFFNSDGSVLENGTVVSVGAKVYVKVTFEEGTDVELHGVSINGTPLVLESTPTGDMYAWTVDTLSPQQVVIDASEFIRYEDIVQPYPAIINLKQDGKTITWGDKLKVGSDIVFVGSANLLPELYTVSDTRYNGVTLYPNTIIKVEKSMVFDNARTYLKANEPSCILSPNRLRIPNSSYKILGYIPDISGRGNNGVIHNSAYAGTSGANGYVYNWNTWRISKSGITSTITDNSLHITSLKGQYNPNQALFESKTVANTGDKADFKVNITGLTSDMKCTFNNAGAVVKELVNGVNEISADLVAGWYGFMITALDGSVIGDCDITIQQIGQYEGSFCLDGVDDFVTIPTLSHGAKQILMKVNWQEINRISYDQRGSGNAYVFAIYISDEGDVIAYNTRNNGKTYIDGVLNSTVMASQLKNITHNIAITNDNVTDANSISPRIGCSNATTFYSKMALFAFMSFDDISSEEEIKELNDIVGIEGGYVERPEYYWDAYGKTNSDADRATIIDQVSKDPANALTANNFAFNEESGYSQIVDTALFKNWVVLNGTTYIEYTLVNDTTINITKSNRASIDAFYCRTNVKKKSYYGITGLKEGQSIQFGFTNNIICTAESDGVYEVDWSLVSENYQYLGTTFVGDCNIIIEQVAQYQNGLLSDGIEDYLINTNMPVLTDYTWIMKRKRLNDNISTLCHKGDGVNNAAFLFEYIEGGQYTRSFSASGTLVKFPDLISYQTKNSYNGENLILGNQVDGNQLRIFMGSDFYPRYTKAVFYKAMLYSKTIDQLSINMLKNLFEKDELIDVNNPIFKNEETD